MNDTVVVVNGPIGLTIDTIVEKAGPMARSIVREGERTVRIIAIIGSVAKRYATQAV
jgi:hypothetical protein